MKVKQRSTCETCRKRKVGLVINQADISQCDGKRPGCSQCISTGRNCDGYQSDWTFVPQSAQFSTTSIHKQTKVKNNLITSPRGPQSCELQVSREYAPLWSIPPTSSDDLLSLIVRSYIPESEMPYITNDSDNKRSRICGSWVEVLPSLSHQATHSCILSAATKALAAAIQSQNPQGPGSTLACTQSYNAAIHALREGFSIADYPLHAEFTAAIMCLTLVEVMFPDYAIGLATHIKGVEQLFQAQGPEAYSSGIPHKLFVGFRPLLVIEAIQRRQPTFLANDPWTTIPFSIFNPSPMQGLLNEAVTIPSLLEHLDTALTTSALTTDRIIPIAKSFTNTRTRLDEWEASLQTQTDGPCYWRVTPGKFVWYPNVTLANVYTHLWTFHIICLSEVVHLAQLFPGRIQEGHNGFRPDLARKEMVILAEKISSSMEYLLQDEMRLFGPASTFLPLRMAYRVFGGGGDAHKDGIIQIERIVQRLVEKGLRSAPSGVFG